MVLFLIVWWKVDDSELLTAFRNGDRHAGEQLFERYFDALYRFFEPKVAHNDVGDLVQRTFLGCVEAAPRFRGEASARTLFYAVAKNQLHDYYRKKQRSPKLDPGLSSLVDLAPSPTSLLGRRERDRLLADAMAQVPLDFAVLLELHYVEGLTGPELARVLDVPEGTIRSRLRRAIEAVREQVEVLSAAPEERASTLENLLRWDEIALSQASLTTASTGSGR